MDAHSLVSGAMSKNINRPLGSMDPVPLRKVGRGEEETHPDPESG